jgi:HAD superfamily hydrolase (TIGR01484 family)
MKYQALIFDIDGTAIHNDEFAVPTAVVVDAVQKAQKLVKVTCATGRPLGMALPIIRALGLKELCVISGGTQIYDPKTNEIIWEKSLDSDTVINIVELCKANNYEVVINDEVTGERAQVRTIPETVYVMFIMQMDSAAAESLLAELKRISSVSAHAVVSWKSTDVFDVHITHKEATKKHAIHLVLEKLDLDPSKVIGVGDGSNDIPLFESVGLKVAMGNASNLLKEHADYVTGDVNDDGLAQVIEEFILKPSKGE